MDRPDVASASSPAELLERLRARIAERRAAGTNRAAVPPPGAVAEHLDRAAHVADVGSALPLFPHLGPLRRGIARLGGHVLLYLLRLITIDQRQFNRLLLRATGVLDREVAAGRARLEELGARLEELGARQEELGARQEEQVAGLFALEAHLQAIDAAWPQLTEALRTLEAGLNERDRWFADLANRDANHTHDIAALRTLEAGLNERDRWFADLANRDASHTHAIADLRTAVAYLRAQIADRDRRIDALLAEVGGGVPAADAVAPQVPVPAADGETMDAWAFAQAFHGDEAATKEHQARYVRYFAGTADVLDVGCGRGEFLELLRDGGVSARGVDLSNDMVLRCREKHLEVIKEDALAYIAALPDASLGGVFAGQVIEHLPTPAILALVRLAYQKLRPDGVLVIETLNPECLLVHYRWFWMDLTHIRLIHPETLKFLLVTTGFRDFEGLFIGPREAASAIPPLQLPAAESAALARFNAATDHLNRLLHGSPDYALIARR